MRRMLFIVAIIICQSLNALNKLPEKYIISYGNPDAKIKVVEYFSFICPHCVDLFRKDFKNIKKEYIDCQKIYWEFHPVPQDLTTVQAMVCLGDLSSKEKKIFLEAILEEIEIDEPDVSSAMMQKAMEVFEKPLGDLKEKSYLSSTNAYQDAFNFLKQDDQINAIPALEINGDFFPHDIPEEDFIRKKFALYNEDR